VTPARAQKTAVFNFNPKSDRGTHFPSSSSSSLLLLLLLFPKEEEEEENHRYIQINQI